MRKILFFLAFFLLSTGLFASQYPDKKSIQYIDDFSYGLYTNGIGNKIPYNAAKYIRNFLIDSKNASITKPNGYAIQGSTSSVNKFNLILPFIKNDNSVEFLCSDNSSLLSTVDFRTYRPIKLGLSSTSDLIGIQYKTKCWFTNGVDPVFTYDGSTVTVLDGNTYGSLRTPNIPRGKCIEAEFKKIWIGNTPTDNSSIYWSTIYSTDGVSVEPDDYRAWQDLNADQIGAGDGQQLIFFRAYGGTLIAGKERSIYSRYGDSNTSFKFIKTRAQTGFVSQASVVEHENLLWGQGYDGFYAFDGENMERVSDNINPDFDTIRADTTRNVTNTWETKSDFNRGTQFYGTTSTAAGFVTILSSINYDVNFNCKLATAINPTSGVQLIVGATPSSSTVYGVYIPTNVPNNFYGYITSMTIQACAGGRDGQAQGTFQLHIRNSRTGEIQVVTPPDTGSCPAYQVVTLNSSLFSSPIYFTGDDLNTGKLTFKLNALTTTGDFDDGTINIIPSTTPFFSDIAFKNSETGSFVSDVATISVNNGWGVFDSVKNNNGGNISYFFRVSTTSTDISTKAWLPISAGSVIPSSQSTTFIQWASTITGYNANIDSVFISHSEGNSSVTRSFSTDWKGNLYIGVSTESTGNFPLIYVKAKKTNTKNPLAWTVLQGYNIRCFAKFRENIYAGHASTGAITRFDYGTNNFGDPIVSVYESPDFMLEPQLTYKDVWEYLLDAKTSNGATLRIGTSLDNATYNYNDVSLTAGTGNTITAINNPNNGAGTFGKLIRIRFENSELDKDLTINNFGIVYIPTEIR